jgi:hypothetical protein
MTWMLTWSHTPLILMLIQCRTFPSLNRIEAMEGRYIHSSSRNGQSWLEEGPFPARPIRHQGLTSNIGKDRKLARDTPSVIRRGRLHILNDGSQEFERMISQDFEILMDFRWIHHSEFLKSRSAR